MREGDDADAMGRRGAADLLGRGRLRPFELAGRGHARRNVHQHHRHGAAQCGGGLREERARERERQETQRRDAEGQQQQLAEPATPRMLHGGGPQIPHGREVDHRFRAPEEEMQGDGYRGGGSADQKERRKEGESKHHMNRLRFDR
jgi:hypothetical protein